MFIVLIKPVPAGHSRGGGGADGDQTAGDVEGSQVQTS